MYDVPMNSVLYAWLHRLVDRLQLRRLERQFAAEQRNERVVAAIQKKRDVAKENGNRNLVIPKESSLRPLYNSSSSSPIAAEAAAGVFCCFPPKNSWKS